MEEYHDQANHLEEMTLQVIIRGGGDVASGVALRLFRAGIRIAICELDKPLAVRRSVSFAQAVYSKSVTIEGVSGILVTEIKHFQQIGVIPIIIDPELSILEIIHPDVIIDARLIKSKLKKDKSSSSLDIGLGPGFIAGDNCHAVVETKRGFTLGRVYWQGTAEDDTGIPEPVSGLAETRVLRSPSDGIFKSKHEIGDFVEKDQPIGIVDDSVIQAPFKGMLRGLLHTDLAVHKGMKIGDIDPRMDKKLCEMVSDKALAIGGGVLEAILSIPELRMKISD